MRKIKFDRADTFYSFENTIDKASGNVYRLGPKPRFIKLIDKNL